MSKETVGLTKEENRRALVLATAGPGGPARRSRYRYLTNTHTV